MKHQQAPCFHLFGEPLGLILSSVHERLEYAATARISIAGAESNVAIGLARMGHQCRFHSAVGADPYGERIVRTLQAEKVDVRHVLVAPEEVTGLITRNCYAWREPDVFYHRHQSAFAANSETVAAGVTFGPGDVFFTTGITLALGESSLRAATRLIELARKCGAIVCLDVNFRRKLWGEAAFRQVLHPLLPSIDILFLGREEGEILTHTARPSAMAKWLLREGAGEVIVKDGEKGAWHFAPRMAGLHSKPFVLRTAVDTIGAGDAFDAGFLAARAAGKSRAECLRVGNAFGALVCLTPGDWESLPSPKDLQNFMEGKLGVAR